MDFDYETELKINKLASEILKTARASGSMSTSEAYNQAKSIILGTQHIPGQQQPHMTSQVPQQAQQVQQEVRQQKQDPSAALREEKQDAMISQLLEANKNLVSEIGIITAKMNEMVAEFNKINGEIAGLKKAASQQQMQQRTAEAPKRVEQSPPTEEPAQQGKGSFDSGAKSTHPRSGGYSPADVDIGKMFYFGNK